MSATGWRPPQYARPQLWSVYVPGTTANVQSQITDTSGTPLPGGSAATGGTSGQGNTAQTYYFDAVLSSDHFITRRFTDHPVQSGASVTYHSYQMPDRVALDVMFSDSQQSYQDGQYSSSIDAYRKFKALMKTGQLVQLNTRLENYPSMGIEEIRDSDSVVTFGSVHFTIVFKEVIVASLSTQTVSSRPDSSQTSPSGTQQSAPVPQSTTDAHSTGSTSTQPPGNTNPDWSSDGSGYAAPGYAP